jgi:hypothetical protein
MRALFFVLVGLCFGVTDGLCAEEFHCEVLSLQGKVIASSVQGKSRELKEGDTLAKDEILETAEDSVVDLAFDKQWKNITRVEEKSRLKIAVIYPTRLRLDTGSVFATLQSLPKDSSFEVQTPTAVATVRGTEYRTTFLRGQTEVFNLSTSPVFVYGVKGDGSVDREQPVVLEQSKKTQVVKAGAAPAPPQEISADEQKVMQVLKTEIKTKIQAAESSGRISKIQDAAKTNESNENDESRVVDLRRRPFKNNA